MPLSLFPIPGLFPSLAVERIIVELEGVAAPGIGGWTTAAVAGIVAVIVALLTHGFTRA